MTQEQFDKLLKYLCMALPYSVIVEDRNGTHVLSIGNTEFADLIQNGKCNIKPYLRPMSSMTCEEEIEWDAEYAYNSMSYKYEMYLYRMTDWLLEHHFDFMGLIPMGLAIDCTDLIIY